MPRKETYAGPISAEAQQNLVSEGIENYELPKSVVMKIAKSSIPENVKLQKETVLSLVKGSTVFINYLAATAHDVALSKQHKSISASDVLKALETIEFSDMVNKLQNELNVYREVGKHDPKSRKASSNGISAGSAKKDKVSGATSASAPVPAKKGKERVSTGNPFPPPYVPPSEETAAPLDAPMEVDEEASASVVRNVSWAEDTASGEEEGADLDQAAIDPDEDDVEPEEEDVQEDEVEDGIRFNLPDEDDANAMLDD